MLRNIFVPSLALLGLLSCAPSRAAEDVLPHDLEEACAEVRKGITDVTTNDVLAVQAKAVARVSERYETNGHSLARCGGAPILTVMVTSGEIAEEDVSFVVDGVDVVLTFSRPIAPLPS